MAGENPSNSFSGRKGLMGDCLQVGSGLSPAVIAYFAVNLLDNVLVLLCHKMLKPAPDKGVNVVVPEH